MNLGSGKVFIDGREIGTVKNFHLDLGKAQRDPALRRAREIMDKYLRP